MTLPEIPFISATSDENSITISWTKSKGASSYLIHLDAALVPTISESENEFRIPDLVSDETYTISILAQNQSGVGNEKQIVATTLPAAIPTDKISVLANENSATITWPNSAPKYKITMNGKESITTSNTIVFKGLASGTKYDYTIAPGNSGGYGRPTPGSFITKQVVVPPSGGSSGGSSDKTTTILPVKPVEKPEEANQFTLPLSPKLLIKSWKEKNHSRMLRQHGMRRK